MKTILKSRQNGFAIIEALIAFLLLGIGVAALIYLQGNLMSGSSTSKARTEAMELAKDRTEMLRNYIQKDQFLLALSNAPAGSVSGVNATYNVVYNNIPTSTDDAQLLTVKVSWGGSDGDTEEVSLDTMLYFTDPVILSALGSGNSGEEGAFPLLSPWITGVEGEDPSTAPIKLADANSDDDDIATTDDGLLGIEINRYIIATTGALQGRSNVEVLYDTDGDGNKEVVLTSFGGIVHKLKGEIIIGSGANTTLGQLTDDLKILASPPSFCVFPINPHDGDGDGVDDLANYVCYVPGDCTYGSVDVNGDPDDRCPANFLPPADDDFEDLNGGWYGRVGNFGIAIHPDDMVCTSDTTKTNLTPSREYVTHRYGDPDDTTKITGNEGINTPYSNQTFLIIRNNTDCADYNVTLVDEQIKRVLVGTKIFDADGPTGTWDKNVVLSENFCVEVDASGNHDPSCPTP